MAVSLTNNEIKLGDTSSPILRFEVWFQSPWGMYTTREGAIERCIAADLDPDAVLLPFPVAIGEGELYEPVSR